MSTESSHSVDTEYVQATKQQVRTMVAEIAQLSKSDVDPAQFYEVLLNRAVSALVATGGAIWTMADSGRLELQYQINLQGTGLAGDEEGQNRHYRLLYKALAEPDGMLVAPHSGPEGDEEAANPTDWLLILGPLSSDREVQGVVEIFQRPGAGPVTQRGYLRFLLQLCDLAGNYLAARQLRNFEDRQTLWGELERFTKSVHDSLDPIRTAFTVVNEGRRLIECDRVSLAIRRGNKYRIEAISHQETIDKRSNIAMLLSRLATRVVATGDSMWYSGNTEDMAPQVEDAVHEYVDESHAKVVGVLPLFKPEKADVGEEEDQEDKKQVGSKDVVGALIVEQFDQGSIKDRMLQRVDVVKDHASSALANALEHDTIFLMPVWRSLGRLKWIVRARTLPKTVAVLIGILIVVLVMLFFPVDFSVEARGQLQPSERRNVFVAEGGLITSIDPKVRSGAVVNKGDELLRLSSLDLDGEITLLEGDLARTKVDLMVINKSLVDSKGSLSPTDIRQRRGEAMQLKKTRESLVAQLKLLNQKRERLVVTSPIDGVIVTWDVRRRLIGRTVEPGQVVMNIADPTQAWELELNVPDNHDFGEIMHRHAELQAAGEGPIVVTYILATDPESVMEGTVKEIQETAEVRNEEGNTVIILVDINKESIDPDQLRKGTSVTAKLYCGKRSLGFWLFHDIIAWIQKNLVFRF